MIPSPAQRVPATGSSSSVSTRSSVGLAAAVGADDADALAARDDELDVEQDRLVAVADVDALEREHALAAARAAAQRERHLAPLEAPGRSTFSMRSICICLTRAWRAARSLTRMCAQWRKRRTASSRRAISFCCVT